MQDQSRTPLIAGCLTVSLFLLLPYVHVMEPPNEPPLELVSIERTDWQPPPLPHPERQYHEPETETLPELELATPQPEVAPLQAVLDFDLDFTQIGGDFDLNFSTDALADMRTDAGAFDLSDIDHHPQPMVQLRPHYPTHARMRQLEGSVTVEFVVSADGHTERVSVLSSEPGTVFCAAAIRAVERWRFSPGTKDGYPVSVRVRQRIRFQLEE
ncbi:MAG: energy transducer TonB [Verrucomicrobia bacterium]|nr:energy transducer TonB [Verrucomicrobiota bacterium]